MKKIIIPAILLIICSFSLSAQRLKDAIYLKNGSIIYGSLLEISDNQYKMRTSDGSLFIYSLDDVEKYVKEMPLFEGRKESGLGFDLEGGFLVGSQASRYVMPFSFNFAGMYTFRTLNAFGFGSGVEFIGQTYTPLFLEYRHLFSDRKSTPFIFARAGGLVYLGDNEENNYDYYPYYYNHTEYKGGASFTAGTGISWAKDELCTYLSFAYRFAHTSYREVNNSTGTTYKNTYNRLEIKFGFSF